MTITWETDSSVWEEQGGSAGFELVRFEHFGDVNWSAQASDRTIDVAQLIGASLPLTCECSQIYPEGFSYCPQCGNKLAKSGTVPTASSEWWGPCGDHALPDLAPRGIALTLQNFSVLESRGKGNANIREDASMPAPPLSPCVFASGAFGLKSVRLIALAYTQNTLQYWDPLAANWIRLEGEDGAADLTFTASDYYWLRPAQTRVGEIALVPTNSGLFKLFINPVTASYRTQMVLAGPLVSAPGQIGDHSACLHCDGEYTSLWSMKNRGGEVQTFRCESGVPTSGWSKPVSYNGRLLWLNAYGHLMWKPGSAPEWLAWQKNWEPRLAFGGPVQSRDGRLWLIGQDEQGYSFVNLGLRDGPIERTDGARLGFGNFVFRLGHHVFENPWDPETIEDENDHHALVLPLLSAYSTDRRNRAGVVLKFEGFVGKASDAIAGLEERDVKLQWIGRQNIDLYRTRVSNPNNFSAFVHAEHLWVHHPDMNEMRGWKMTGSAP